MNKNILYIGNNLKNKSSNITTLEVLSSFLKQEGYNVYKSSDKNHKIVRLLDMCYSFIKNRRRVDYVLIDTYSTINFYYALIISQMARIFKIKYIPILHGGNLPDRLENSPSLSRLIFKNSYKNIAPSNYLKNQFEKKKYNTLFIPNTLNICEYPFKERTVIRPKLLWVRAFKELYNPALAIEVLRLVQKKYPKAHLCMIGPFVDESHRECLDLVEKYGLENFVEFTGILPKKKWHKKSKEFDVFINTTNFDNTPISVMEAMALGLSIVSTNVGGMPYLVKNEFDGILVDKNNPVEMTNAIIAVLKGEYPKMTINARNKIEEFDWSIVKHKWLKVLK